MNTDRKSDTTLELGRYNDAELLELAQGDVQGASWSLVITAISGYISANTCPTTACTSSC